MAKVASFGCGGWAGLRLVSMGWVLIALAPACGDDGTGGQGGAGGAGPVACEVDTECTEAPKFRCSPTLLVCVECLTSGDCGPVAPACKDASVCVECVVPADCPAEFPTCTADNLCI